MSEEIPFRKGDRVKVLGTIGAGRVEVVHPPSVHSVGVILDGNDAVVTWFKPERLTLELRDEEARDLPGDLPPWGEAADGADDLTVKEMTCRILESLVTVPKWADDPFGAVELCYRMALAIEDLCDGGRYTTPEVSS